MKIRSMAGYIAVLAALPLGCTIQNMLPEPAAEEKTPGSIAGKVVQSQSKAVVFIEQGRALDSVAIDPGDGYFAFDAIPAGAYRLKVTAEGYDTVTSNIVIEDGKTYNIGYLVLVKRNRAFNDSTPSVNDHYPKDDAEQIYLPPGEYNKGSARLFISVSFDRPMNRESVEKVTRLILPALRLIPRWRSASAQSSRRLPITA
jgi:hypothetical protein